MLKKVKRAVGAAAIVAALAATSAMGGCAYGGVAASGDYAVVTRNDGLLSGALRKVFVCKITSDGLKACKEGVSP